MYDKHRAESKLLPMICLKFYLKSLVPYFHLIFSDFKFISSFSDVFTFFWTIYCSDLICWHWEIISLYSSLSF